MTSSAKVTKTEREKIKEGNFESYLEKRDLLLFLEQSEKI